MLIQTVIKMMEDRKIDGRHDLDRQTEIFKSICFVYKFDLVQMSVASFSSWHILTAKALFSGTVRQELYGTVGRPEVLGSGGFLLDAP